MSPARKPKGLLPSLLLGVLHHPRLNRAIDETLDAISRYFRVEWEGLENLPESGPVLLIANHSGYSGADVLILTHGIRKRRGRRPRIMAHPFFFKLGKLEQLISESFGLREASFKSGKKALSRKELLLLFPEAEMGNFKPSSERYKLRPFHTGFLRLALASGAPIVPCLIIGAEETHLNLGRLDLSFLMERLSIPVPVNLIPLPAKWWIKILPAIKVPSEVLRPATGAPEPKPEPTPEPTHDELCAMAENIRKDLQAALDAEVARRPYVFFPTEKP